MEITSYQEILKETHVEEGCELGFIVRSEIIDTVAYYPTTGDKEYPGSSCDWTTPDATPDEEDWDLYKLLKREYHEKYGPLTLKQYSTRMKLMMEMFQDSDHMACFTKRYIRRVWMMKQIYELADASLQLLFTRLKRGIVTLYERAVRFKNENTLILSREKDKKMEKYTKLALTAIDCFLEKVNTFILENPYLLSSLCFEAKVYFLQSTPAMISTIKSLPWIDYDLLPHVQGKYYASSRDFWGDYLVRTFCPRNLVGDVCKRIAEYIPKKIEGSSFIDFFRKHFDIKTKSYIGNNNLLDVTLFISSAQRTEIMVILK